MFTSDYFYAGYYRALGGQSQTMTPAPPSDDDPRTDATVASLRSREQPPRRVKVAVPVLSPGLLDELKASQESQPQLWGRTIPPGVVKR